MTMTRLGRGFGVVMTVLAVVGIPSMSAFADSTCYTNCSPPTTLIGSGGGGGTSGSGGGTSPVTGGQGSGGHGPGTGSGSGSGGSGSGGSNAQTAGVSTKASGGGLPFTGADVEEMTAIGAGALVIGGILVRRGRNRRRAES